MKICNVCHSENNDQNAFCQTCGAQLSPVPDNLSGAPVAEASPSAGQSPYQPINYQPSISPDITPQSPYFQQPNYQQSGLYGQPTHKSVRGEDLAVAALTAVASMYVTFLFPGSLKVWIPFIAAGILSIVALVYTKSQFSSLYMKTAIIALVASILFIPVMLFLS